jgi:hypothetical protein
MDADEAVDLLSCGEEETEFLLRFQILMRMHNDEKFTKEVVDRFKPTYYSQ